MRLDTRPVLDLAGTRPGLFKTSSYLENTNRKSYTRPVWLPNQRTAEAVVSTGDDGVGGGRRRGVGGDGPIWLHGRLRARPVEGHAG